MGTSIDYSTVSHETIYQRITGGPGSAELMDASRGWQSVAAKLRDLHRDVEQAIRGIGAAQQGAAADAATHATMTLMPWLDDSVAAANAMAARIAHQANSFGHTRDTMPAPVKVPQVSFSQDPATWIGEHAVEWLPGIQTEHERAQVAAQQAEQRARELMTSYQNTSNDNLAISQPFTMAPTVIADVSGPTPGGAGFGGASVGGSAAHGVLHSSAALGAHSAAAVAEHAAGIAPADTAPQIASTTRQVSAVFISPQLAGGYPDPQGQLMTGSGTVPPAAAADFGPPPVLAGSGAASGHRRSGGSRGFAGGVPASRGGGFGPRPTAALSEAHSPTGSTEHASASRATHGGGGWANAPFGGATGGSGRDRDTEHRRPSYLIEHDTNAIVGDLPQVAPPVIGED
jgi:hypothetical protein